MSRCWTCSTKQEATLGDVYVCEACENISDQIRSLEKTERGKISKIDDLLYIQRETLDTLAEGMYGISSAIERGFDEVSWELQQQTEVLHEIAAILKTPSEIKANEWRQMGEKLRRRDVYNEAVEFFLKSLETNPLDYRTYIGLGKAYLHLEEFGEAKKYFEKSLFHAPVEFYKSYSLHLIGRIYYCSEDYVQASSTLRSSIELSPTYADAHYDYAQYCLPLGERENSITSLRKAILNKPLYFYLVQKEKNFDPIRSEVQSLLEEISMEAFHTAEKAISKSESMLQKAQEDVYEAKVHWNKARQGDKKEIKSPSIYGHAESKLNLAKDKVASGDYMAFLEANPIIDESINYAHNAMNTAHKECIYYEGKNFENIKTGWTMAPLLCIGGAIVFSIIGAIGGCAVGVGNGAAGTGSSIGATLGAIIGFILGAYFSFHSTW